MNKDLGKCCSSSSAPAVAAPVSQAGVTVWWGFLPLAAALGFCSVKGGCQPMESRSAPKQLHVMAGGGLFVVSVGLWFFLAFTGALFRMHLGLQGLAGGVVFGTVFG